MFYAINQIGGGVTILQTVGDASPKDVVKKWHPDQLAEHDLSSITTLDPAHVPQDRTFRNAWHLNNGAIKADIERARDILRDMIRTKRAPLLAALDVEFQRADEKGDASAKKRIAAEKQKLRDATDDPAIAGAKTCEELKAHLARLN